jgi:excisionase family DNA binding protein
MSITAKAKPKPKPEEKWLSLANAAQFMGVHPATLRVWADRGRIVSQRTAGGHRRFSRADLDAWMAAHRASDAGAQVLAQTALGRLRLEMERADAPWLEGSDEETRRAYRELGRRLMQEIVRAVSAAEISGPVRDAAESIGQQYAALSLRRSLSLSQAVRAFLFFRDNIVDALVQMAGALEPVAAPSWQAVHHQLSAFLNEVLIALIRAYGEKPRDGNG